MKKLLNPVLWLSAILASAAVVATEGPAFALYRLRDDLRLDAGRSDH